MKGSAGIKGLAVSLDTFKNTTDPSSNFVGIATTSSRTHSLNYVTTNSSIPPLRNTVHHFVVTTSTTGMNVTMDGTQVLAYTTSLPANVLVGFTGATGGANDIHRVQNVSITTGPPPPAPTVTAVSPTSGPSTGGTSVTVTGTNLDRRHRRALRRHRRHHLHRGQRHHHHRHRPGRHRHRRRHRHHRRRHQHHQRRRPVHLHRRPAARRSPCVSPTSGPSTGGTTVTVTGTNLTGATAVRFGATAATTFTVANATTITATAPAGTGTVDVTVTTAGGTSTTSAADQYTYTAAPPPGTIPSPVSGGWQLNGTARLIPTRRPPTCS